MVSKKVSAFNRIFDSTIEYERYLFLLEAQANGLITSLTCQPSVTLEFAITLPVNALRPKAVKQRAITYSADYRYIYKTIEVYEDVKGSYGHSHKNYAKGIAGKPIMTEASRLRHKLLQAREPNAIFCIVTTPTQPIATTWSKT